MGGAATHPQEFTLTPAQPHDSSSPRRSRYRSRSNPNPNPSPNSNSNSNSTASPNSNPFHRGAEIEVQTDEEDYKGVYFKATVLQPPVLYTSKNGSKRKSKRLYVEYRDLLAREDGSERLKEYVGIRFARPAPPPVPIIKPLEPGDAVDAFYKDGWWTGVIKQTLEGGEKYIVSFQYPPDELEFKISDIRVHFDWVNRTWVRPQKQSIAGLMFDVGRKVEVSLDRENCHDAWFPATIHKQLGNGAFLVEYHSTDNDSHAIKVAISYPCIRPCPPFLKDKNFVLLEKVDAFFDSGWWTGVITKELENGRYNVYFRQLKKDEVFYQSELRPHMEWKDGKWFTSSQAVPIHSSDVCMHEQKTPESFGASAVIPLNSLGDKTDTTLFSCTTGKGRSDQTLDDHVPTKRLDEGNLVGEQNKFTHDSSSKDMICGSVSPVSVTNISISETQTVTGDLLSDNTSWGKRIRRKRKNNDETPPIGEKVNSTPNSMKATSVPMLQPGSTNHDDGGKRLGSVGNNADIQNELAEKEAEFNVVIGLPCAEMGSSEMGKRKHHASDKKQQLSDSTVKDNSPSETGDLVGRKKRGRPRKISLEGMQSAAIGNAEAVVVNSDDLNKKHDDPNSFSGHVAMEMDSSLLDQGMLLNDGKSTGHSDPNNENQSADAHPDPKNKSKLAVGLSVPKNGKGSNSSKRKRIPSKRFLEKDVKESPQLRGRTHSTSRGKKLNPGGKAAAALQVPGLSDEVGGKMKEVDQAIEVDNVGCEAPNNELDDEPLSKWIEVMHSPSVADGPRASPVSTVDPCMEIAKKKGNDILPDLNGEILAEGGSNDSGSALVNTESMVNTELIDRSEPQTLPFAKNTVLWQTIESMEVFQRIPQKPHFKPLENFKESSREGLAIGCMVTFSSVVEKISRLQFDDPVGVTDDILETLADLERHGFEVNCARDRVNELLAVREKNTKLVDEVKVLNNQLAEHNHERNKIDEVIKEINEEMRKLQEKLSLVESAKEKQDGEIASLHARIMETEDIMENSRGSEFQGIASAPWGKV